jgi:hypothetical protein
MATFANMTGLQLCETADEVLEFATQHLKNITWSRMIIKN